jgi:1,2-diacylglycerol 3-alpha-glucosyltransferase
MDQMRIVFSTFFRESKGGGGGRVSYEIAQAFARQGHDTVLVCPGEKTGLTKVAPNFRYLEIKSLGEGDVSIPYLTVNNLKFLFDFLEKFRPQIIHGHDYGPTALVTQFWAINHHLPFLYTGHVLPTKFSEFSINEFSESLGRFYNTDLMKKYLFNFYNNCDAWIALNKEAQKDVLKYGFKEKIFIIPNGRDMKDYYRCRPAQLSEKQKQLTFIGYLSQRKNQKYLLQVMEHLPENFLLNLIGTPVNPEYLEDLKKYIEKKHLKNINFMGEIPYQQIPRILEKTHVFVSASRMEVQSLVIIEALASGTPVVGLANGTVDELVDESTGYRLEKNASPKIFSEHIQKICSLSQKEYEVLCQNTRGKVSHLDWTEIIKKTEIVYQKLIEDKKIDDQITQKNKFKNLKEIISLLPSSKIKIFLKKKLQDPKLNFQRNKNIFSFIFTVIGTSLIGFLYWLLRKTKRIHY